MNIAMIPARMGSQRLVRKNLRRIRNEPLITHAIRKCKEAGCFDEIWVNSEHKQFGEIAKEEGVSFHQRPAELANSVATSEQYVAEFLHARECDAVFQVHSIAPLLSIEDIAGFVDRMKRGDVDCLLSVENIQIECALNGEALNFSFSSKTNSQDLDPVQRICWSITGWDRSRYLDARLKGQCATYCGRVGFHSLNALASHVVKTEEDLNIAAALFPLLFPDTDSYARSGGGL